MAINVRGLGKKKHNQAAPVSHDVQLARRGVYRMEGKKHGPAVTCVEGMVWVTQTDDHRDYVLRAGDRLPITRRGNVLVEAIRDARVNVTN